MVAACQPLPRPFQPADKHLTVEQLVALGPLTGIVVAPVEAEGLAVPARFAARVAEEMRERGVPAIADEAGEKRFVLHGRIAAATAPNGERRLDSEWRLVDPGDATHDAFEVSMRLADDAGEADTRAALAVTARQVASTLAARLAGDEGAEPAKLPQVAVREIDGAPDGGTALLADALTAALRMRGVHVAAAGAPQAFAVRGEIERSSAGAGRERIVLQWALLRPDGSTVGVVGQENELPAGELERQWRAAAPVIAAAAADGLLDLLRTRVN